MAASNPRALGGSARFSRWPGTLLMAVLFALVVWGRGTAQIDAARESVDSGQLVGILADPLHVSMGAVYGAFVREAMDGGAPYMHNSQTTNPHPPTLLRPYEYAIGRLGRALQPAEPARFAFEAERLIGLLLFVGGLATLAHQLLTSWLLRAVFLGLGCFGGNLFVWVQAVGGPRVWLDTNMPHLSGLGFSYPAYLLGVPHLAAEVGCAAFAMAGILGLVASARRGLESRAALGFALLGGLAILGVASVRPYTAPVLWIVGLIAWYGVRAMQTEWSAARRMRWLALGAGLLLPAPPMLLAIRASLGEGSAFAALNVVHPSPPMVEQLLFFGFPALGALLLFLMWTWISRRWHVASPRALGHLLLWLGLGTALANAGPWVAWEVEAMSPLALAWLCVFMVLVAAVLEAGARAASALAWGLVVVAAGLGLWSAQARDVELAAAVARHERHLVLTPAEAAAVDWLRAHRAELGSKNAATDRTGLARDAALPGIWCEASPLATMLPWLAGVRVFLGHPDHTPDSAERLAFSQRFRRDGKGLSLLGGAGVTHLLSWPFPPEARQPDPLDGRAGLLRLVEGNFRIDAINEVRKD
jgi:hypothetical protein